MKDTRQTLESVFSSPTVNSYNWFNVEFRVQLLMLSLMFKIVNNEVDFKRKTSSDSNNLDMRIIKQSIDHWVYYAIVDTKAMD